uniref:TolC family protein n=1 Tax=Aquabacterium sp. TaxID=1872578 RepID=UPI0025B7EE9E
AMLLTLALLTLGGTAPSAADTPPPTPRSSPLGSPLMPPDEVLQATLSQHPLWLARQARGDAERHRADMARQGGAEWTPSFSLGQRSYHGTSAGEPRTREWSAELARGLRLPAKARADQTLADSQIALSQADTRLAWHELTLGLIQAHGSWLKALRQEAIWRAQADLADRQWQASQRRLQLGDAARIEVTQLAAQKAQAQAQLLAATQQRQALAAQLGSRYPAWPLQPTDASTAPGNAAKASSFDLARQAMAGLPSPPQAGEPTRHPALLASERAQALAGALARQADAERVSDPIVGVQIAQDRSGSERLLALTVSWPWGGEHRRLNAAAQQQDAHAAARLADDQRTRLLADLRQAWQDTQDTAARWALAHEAHTQLSQAAASLEKGFRLGEGQLGELIQPQRLANEAALQEAQAEVDTWLAIWRWQLESGQRWVAPEHD